MMTDDERRVCELIQQQKAALGEHISLQHAYDLLQQYVAMISEPPEPLKIDIPMISSLKMESDIEVKNYKGYIPVPETYRSKKKRFR